MDEVNFKSLMFPNLQFLIYVLIHLIISDNMVDNSMQTTLLCTVQYVAMIMLPTQYRNDIPDTARD